MVQDIPLQAELLLMNRNRPRSWSSNLKLILTVFSNVYRSRAIKMIERCNNVLYGLALFVLQYNCEFTFTGGKLGIELFPVQFCLESGFSRF